MKVIRRLSSGTLLMLIMLTLVLAVSSVLESVLIKYLSDAVIMGDRKLFLLMFLAVPVYLIVDTFFHYARQYRAALAGVQIQNNLRAELFRRIGLSPVELLTGRAPNIIFRSSRVSLKTLKPTILTLFSGAGTLPRSLFSPLSLLLF